MGIHIVGSTRRAHVRLSSICTFRGVRRLVGELDPAGEPDQASFRRARIDCQLGADAKTGDTCLDCPRLFDWRAGPEPGQVIVSCMWTHLDPVSARMTVVPALVTVSPQRSCVESDRLAAAQGVHRLLVLDENRLVGVACRCDLAAGEVGSVSEVMATEVFVIDPAAGLGEAAAAMSALNIGCLPVVRDGFLVGIVTRGDLRRAGAPPDVVGPGA